MSEKEKERETEGVEREINRDTWREKDIGARDKERERERDREREKEREMDMDIYIYIYIYIYMCVCLLLSESTQSRDLNFALEAFKASLRTYFRNIYYRVILLNRHRSFDWSWLKVNQKVFL